MPPRTKMLAHFKRNMDLVSIAGDGVDDRRIQAFVLGYSQDLLLLQYVYDFHIDGRLLIRRKDITSIRCGATDIFQKGLLDTEGLLESTRFTPTQPIQSYGFFAITGSEPACDRGGRNAR